ncbi:ATP-dependent Clp protease adaptor ClpS [Leptospira idonii]|uniref:ATP-dependent Clp protease adaptor ClpS n=1 Tax=Leptospira idonii TaxID=1193500 RepID=A0A4R9LWY9_9LEPT|nr:ATP-dependent Clp protease adaptor ClpS [Leptospira idonii]TGN17886.1 ATP-dependent Clp protease adaptor ClpS [Leptospira idonii]
MTDRKPPQTEIIPDNDLKTEDIYFYRVILFNDSVNDFDHVEDCLIKICFKNKKEAKKIALEAHNNGKAVCFTGSSEECETVAEKLSLEQLTVSVTK